MNNANPLLTVALLLSAASTPTVAQEHIVCPGWVRLAPQETRLQEVPAGYSLFISGSVVRLSGVSAYDGPPEDGAILKPITHGSNSAKIEWRFNGAFDKGKWLSCDFANGLIRLTREIAKQTVTCTAMVSRTEPQKTLEADISCQ